MRIATENTATQTATTEEVLLLTFKLDEQTYALAIDKVVQVVRMVAITRAPKAPDYVEGMINLRGKVIPVINLRKRFGLPSKPIELNDHLLIAETDGRVMALIVDVVSEVVSLPVSALDRPADLDSESLHYLWAVGKLGDELVLILDLDKTLTFEDQKRLQQLFRGQPLAQELSDS